MNICLAFLKLFIVQDGRTDSIHCESVETRENQDWDEPSYYIKCDYFCPFCTIYKNSRYSHLKIVDLSPARASGDQQTRCDLMTPVRAMLLQKNDQRSPLLWHFWGKIRHYLNTIKRRMDTDFSNSLKVTRHCERNICIYVEYFWTVFSVGQLLFLSWFQWKVFD